MGYQINEHMNHNGLGNQNIEICVIFLLSCVNIVKWFSYRIFTYKYFEKKNIIMSKNPVVHFEMGYFDAERMKNFYTNVFGWNLQQMGPEMGNYIVAHTAETDSNNMVTVPGTINGGFYQKNDDPMSHAPSVVLSVPDIRAAIKAVETGGGKILGAMNASGDTSMEPMMIPGVGLWISFLDTEGNRVSLLQTH